MHFWSDRFKSYRLSINRANDTGGQWMVITSCKENNNMHNVEARRTVHTVTCVLVCCLFPSLLRKLGNKHQNTSPVNALSVRFRIWISNYMLLMYLHVITYSCPDSEASLGISVSKREPWKAGTWDSREKFKFQSPKSPIKNLSHIATYIRLIMWCINKRICYTTTY